MNPDDCGFNPINEGPRPSVQCSCGNTHRNLLYPVPCAVRESSKVHGWMEPIELEWLATAAFFRKRIVEFGCYKGRSTKALAMATRGTVYAVDWWPGSMEVEILPEFRKNLSSEIDNGKCRFFRLSTMEFCRRASSPNPPQMHMVFIDASHDYESVKEDIRIAIKLLAPGGLLCGHDFSDEFPGVQRAVIECVPGYQRGPGSIWWKEI